MQKNKSGDYIQEPISTVNGDISIKRYTKIKIIGEGAFSKCWLVRTLNSDSTYAVKVIPTAQLKFLTIKKLVYEVRIHQQLSHPNVVHLDHWFQDQQNKYIFMEYCSQGNLQKRSSTTRMSEKQIAYFMKQVISAISYLHSKDVLHRDLKLSNFYINNQNQIKLGDFGFACQLTHFGQLKRQSCGTPNYVAPEAVGGFGYSFSSDVWTVGIMLYRMKFNCCPFQDKTVKETLQRVKICQYKFPKGEKISSELKDLIQKILVINYDDRLTLPQILNHPFFVVNSDTSIPLPLQSPPSRSRSQTWGFSFFDSLFDRGKQKRSLQSMEQDDNDVSKKEKQLIKQNEGKHNNSCSTFKEIKEIFKNKNRGAMLTDFSTEENLGITTIRQAGRGLMSTSSLKCIPESVQRTCSISKRFEKHERVNTGFGHKHELKISSKQAPVIIDKVFAHSIKQLAMLMKRYYLPYRVQFEREVVVVHYKDSIKQILYHGSSYIMHRDKGVLYQMNGQPLTNVPKLLKYLVQNKITISQAEPEEKEYGENTIQKILLFVAHRWFILKDGVFLYFGNSGVQVAKLINQQLFYASDDKEDVVRENKLSLLYMREERVYKCVQDAVQSRIYRNWVGNVFKTIPSKK